MVTGDQELQWAYLLCPTFELSNSEGKPLTNGYIELYIAGTRDKYYAASDFAGTLHPFQIPLDSLGSNIVLVSPDNAYDIYVYNRFGNLVMSRYNVVPTNGAAGGGSSSSNISIESGDGTVVVTESTDPETGVKTFDLSVPSVSGNPSFWTGRGAATMGVTISDTEYHKIDVSEHSIRNRNDDITVVNGEFNLKKGVYFWNVTVQLDKYESHDNTRQRVFIESGYNRGAYTMDMTHDETETISFSGITVADYDDTKHDIKIKSEGESPFKAVLYNVSIHKLNQNVLGDNGTTYTAGDYIEITEDDVINVTGLTTPEDVEAMIDVAITALASGDIYTGGDYINIENHVISVTGLQPEGDYLTQEDLEGYATETYVDNSVSSFTTHTEVYESTVTAIQAATGAIPEQLEAGDYISIENNTINVTGLQPAGEYLTPEDLEGYATEEYVTTYVDNSVSSFVTEEEVTAMLPETEDVTFKELDITQFAQASAIPDVSDFATHTEVYEAVVTGVQLATSMIPDLEGYATEEYVTTYVDNSVSSFTTHTEVYDATVTAVQLATAQIPDQLEAGQYIDITNNIINVTGLQPAGEYLTPEDLEGYATESYVTTYVDNSVSSFATNTEVYEAIVTGVQLATAQIPDQLEAGDYISIVNNTINVTGLQPEGDYATNADVHEATVTAIEHVTALIPEAQVQSDWTEADTEDPSYIQHKPQEVRLVAGDNINITETATSVVISAADSTEYTEGWGIDINNNTISVVSSIIPSVQLNSNDQVTAIDNHTLVGKEYTAGSNIEINNDAISLKDVVHIDSRNEAPEGYIRVGNIVHWGHDDYGPGIMVSAIMDDYMDSRDYVWYNTSDQGRDERFWGQYDNNREAMSVSGESFLSIHEGDITYQRGDFDRTDRVPVIWSCSGMRYDIDRLQESVTAIPTYTAGDHISIENDEIAVTGVGNLVAGDNITITESGDNITISAADGGKTYTAGQYISIDSNDVIAVTGLAPVSGSDGITVNNNVVSLDTPVEIVAGDNITISVTGASAIFSAQTVGVTEAQVYDATVTSVQTATGWVDSQGYLTEVPSTYATDTEVSEAIASSITDFVTEGQVTALIPDSEEVDFEELDITQFAQASAIPTIELNSSNQVTAIDGYAIAGGGSSTQVQADWNEVDNTSPAYILNKPDIPTVQLNSNDQVTAINNHEIAGTGGGTTYTAGDYISIDNNIISVTGVAPVTAIPESEEVDFEELDITQFAQASAIPEYTAGQYISIDANNEISVTGLQVAGSYATTSDISDMATKTWVGNQGYLTAVPNTYATKVYVDSSVSGKQDKLTAGSNISISGNTIAVTGMPAAPVQSDWNVTNSSSLAYIKNKPTLWTPSFNDSYTNITTLTTGSGQQIGTTGIYVKFNPGNFLTSYTIDYYRMTTFKLNEDNNWHILLSIQISNVIGSQWSYNNNVVVITGGAISSGPAMFNCFSEWDATPWCQLAVYSNWDTKMNCINRDIRNSSTADNHKLFINLDLIIHKT